VSYIFWFCIKSVPTSRPEESEVASLEHSLLISEGLTANQRNSIAIKVRTTTDLVSDELFIYDIRGFG
jgi:hypothetical protein